VFVSVLTLFRCNQRLSDYQVKIQPPIAGWLILEPVPQQYRGGELQARLVNEKGEDLLPLLDEARVTASGRRGMLIEGVTYRRRSAKHSYREQQAWWCQAPPLERPLVDHQARVRAGEKALLERLGPEGG
jgi:hypothetical protein